LSWTLFPTYLLMCAIQMTSAGDRACDGQRASAPTIGAMGAALQLILLGPQWLYVAAFAILIAGTKLNALKRP
jgi:hypothetical protein